MGLFCLRWHLKLVMPVWHIEGARLSLASLSLTSYGGENVTECETGAQRNIILMQTGSLLLGKFTHMSCEYFNCKVYNLLDRARDMEHNCNPKDLFLFPHLLLFLLLCFYFPSVLAWL